MKKKYEEVVHIALSATYVNQFYEKVSDRIEEMQNKGYEVEVQYAQSENLFSALVLGFKREDSDAAQS